MTKKAQKVLALLLLCSIPLLLTACEPKISLSNPFKKEEEEIEEKESPFKKDLFKKDEDLEDLLNEKRRLDCTLTQTIEEEKIKSKLFTDGTNIYMETYKPGGNEVVAKVVYTEEAFYSWNVEKREGFKVTFPEELSLEEKKATGPLADLENINFSCRTWREIDTSIFKVPEDINIRGN